MKKLIVVVLILVSSLGCAGTSAAIRKAVVEVEATNKIVAVDYLGYVSADPKLDETQKDDRKKVVDSLWRLMEALKKASE
jgi:hypothetical protein